MTTSTDDVLVAGVGMLHRTGATDFTLTYVEDNVPAVIWVAAVTYRGGHIEAAAGLDPRRAVLRLCELLVDGGMCAHCNRPTGFEPDRIGPMPNAHVICWYQYDPELKTFRRGCEGS